LFQRTTSDEKTTSLKGPDRVGFACAHQSISEFARTSRFGLTGVPAVENPSDEPYAFRYFVLQFRIRCSVRDDEWLGVWGSLPLLHDCFNAPLPMKKLRRSRGQIEWALRVRFPKHLYDGCEFTYIYCLLRKVSADSQYESSYEVVGCEPCPLRKSILSSEILPYGFYEHDDRWGHNDGKVYPRQDRLGVLVYKHLSRDAAPCRIS
jgi:hypothetical protein